MKIIADAAITPTQTANTAEFLWQLAPAINQTLANPSTFSEATLPRLNQPSPALAPSLFRDLAPEKTLALKSLADLFPHVIALEQMRQRAVEQLSFERDQIQKTWWNTDQGVQNKKAYQDYLIRQVNEGITALIAALVSGRAASAEAALAHAEDIPGFSGPGARQSGDAFRNNLLQNSGVDVEALLEYSNLQETSAQEQWLLNYTEALRTRLGSLNGYPFHVVLKNCLALSQAANPEVRERATALLQEVMGQTGWSGMTDAQWATIEREGVRNLIPMVAAGMVAGPLGAYMEGSAVAVRLTLGGKTLLNAEKLGLLARGIGVAGSGTAFWLTHDALHSTFLGGGEYFTAKGWAKSLLMLGALQAVMSRYAVAAAPWANGTVPQQMAEKAVGFIAEWATFFGVGQVEKAVGLVPAREVGLRQEIIEAGVNLVLLKGGMKLGEFATQDALTAKTIELKLDTAQKLLEQAYREGRIAVTTHLEMTQALLGMQQILDQIQGMGPQLAWDGAAGMKLSPSDGIEPFVPQPMQMSQPKGKGKGQSTAKAGQPESITPYDQPTDAKAFYQNLKTTALVLFDKTFAQKQKLGDEHLAYLGFALQRLGLKEEATSVFGKIKKTNKQITSLKSGELSFNFNNWGDPVIQIDTLAAKGEWEAALQLVQAQGNLKGLAYITEFYSRLTGYVDERTSSPPPTPSELQQLKAIGVKLGNVQVRDLLEISEVNQPSLREAIQLASMALIELKKAEQNNQPTDAKTWNDAMHFLRAARAELTRNDLIPALPPKQLGKALIAIENAEEYLKSIENRYPLPARPRQMAAQARILTYEWAKKLSEKSALDAADLTHLAHLGLTLLNLGEPDAGNRLLTQAKEGIELKVRLSGSAEEREAALEASETINDLADGEFGLVFPNGPVIYNQMRELFKIGEWQEALEWVKVMESPESLAMFVSVFVELKKPTLDPKDIITWEMMVDSQVAEANFWNADAMVELIQISKSLVKPSVLKSLHAVLGTIIEIKMGENEAFYHSREVALEQIYQLVETFDTAGSRGQISIESAERASLLLEQLRAAVWTTSEPLPIPSLAPLFSWPSDPNGGPNNLPN